MNASKLLAGAVVTVSVLGSLGGLAHAQSTGTGTAPGGGMQRSEMGQSQNPGATTSTDPSTLQTNPRWNPSSDSTMQRPDGSSSGSRNQNSTGTGIGSDMNSGRDSMSEGSTAPLRERQPKSDRN